MKKGVNTKELMAKVQRDLDEMQRKNQSLLAALKSEQQARLTATERQAAEVAQLLLPTQQQITRLEAEVIPSIHADYQQQLDKLRQELKAKEAAIEAQKAPLTELVATKMDLERNLAQALYEKQELQQQNAQLQQQNTQLRFENARRLRSSISARANLRDAQKSVTKGTKARDELLEQLCEAQDALTNSNRDYAELRKDYERLKMQYAARDQEISALVALQEASEATIAHLTRRLEAVESGYDYVDRAESPQSLAGTAALLSQTNTLLSPRGSRATTPVADNEIQLQLLGEPAQQAATYRQ